MRRHRTFFVVGLFVCLFIAGVASFYASSAPDGLEKVATDKGFAETAEEHDSGDSPLADYATRGLDNDRLSGAVAGLAGVGLTLVVAGGLFYLLVVRRGGPRRSSPER